jgi:D-alanyl-D-alanine carboxypeptidase
MKHVASFATLRRASLAASLAFAVATPAVAEKYAAIVVDMDTDQVLHAENADDERYPASLTKVMTLYMVFDALDAGEIKLSERLPVSRKAARQQPSKLGLTAGSTIRLDDAVRALVTKSANDVAVVIAERLGGTESEFAEMMTRKARELGLENTRFTNASGLPDARQVSTARDLAELAEAVFLNHRDYYYYFATSEFVWKKQRFKNHNTLLGRVPGVDGIKTGYTSASGYNLMASAERDGRRVIAVMLGGSTGKSRDAHVADLVEAAFGYMSEHPVDVEQLVAMGRTQYLSADQLASLQLQRLTAQPAVNDAGLVAIPASEVESGAGDFLAQGDADFDPIGALIEQLPTRPF